MLMMLATGAATSSASLMSISRLVVGGRRFLLDPGTKLAPSFLVRTLQRSYDYAGV